MDLLNSSDKMDDNIEFSGCNITQNSEIDTYILKNKELIKSKRSIAKEANIEIIVNDSKLLSLLCYPDKIKELIVGFLINEGIISDLNQIKSMDSSENGTEVYIHGDIDSSLLYTWKEKKQVTTGCGGGLSAFMNFNIDASNQADLNISFDSEIILKSMKEMLSFSEIYKQTHCIHTCGIGNHKELIYIAEDIGRHNALDKVIGMAILNKDTLTDKILYSTGRISSEMALKVIRQRIPVIISRTAITYNTLRMALKSLTTVAGFARGSSLEIFSYPGRIKF